MENIFIGKLNSKGEDVILFSTNAEDEETTTELPVVRYESTTGMKSEFLPWINVKMFL